MNIHKKDTKRKIPIQLVNERGFPKPIEAKCFQCENSIQIKYVVPKKRYSFKNNWEYWTNPEAKEINTNFWKNKEARKKDKHICDNCLIELYYDKERFWETVKDLKKRNKLRGYIWLKVVK